MEKRGLRPEETTQYQSKEIVKGWWLPPFQSNAWVTLCGYIRQRKRIQTRLNPKSWKSSPRGFWMCSESHCLMDALCRIGTCKDFVMAVSGNPVLALWPFPAAHIPREFTLTSCKGAEGPWLLPCRPQPANKENKEGSASDKSHSCKCAGSTSKFPEVNFRDGFTEWDPLGEHSYKPEL